MTAQQLINSYNINKIIANDIVIAIDEDDELRKDIIRYFRLNKNRELALTLLHKITELRSIINTHNLPASGDSIMLCCYILGLHGHIEDCIEIWIAKETDFDTFCYVDVQLAVFGGVNNTLEYLKDEPGREARDAYHYISGCNNAGNFDDIKDYYNKDIPWFV